MLYFPAASIISLSDFVITLCSSNSVLIGHVWQNHSLTAFLATFGFSYALWNTISLVTHVQSAQSVQPWAPQSFEPVALYCFISNFDAGLGPYAPFIYG